MPIWQLRELRRCAVELGFPGVVIASELQGLPPDAEVLRPFWKAATDLGLYVFVHPLPRVIAWQHMDADDLGRMLGWEFSLMVATVRLINSGLLDELLDLQILLSHFGGGIGRYLPRIRGIQDRATAGTAGIPRHGRQPRQPFEHYLRERLFFDCAGWSSLDAAAANGSEWVRAGLTELPASRCVFATDYPQGVRDDGEVAAYVEAIRALGPDARAMFRGGHNRGADPRPTHAPEGAHDMTPRPIALKTARMLGLTIPAPILVRADQLIQ